MQPARIDTALLDNATDPTPRTIRIEAEGAALSGTLYRPAGRARAAVVIHGATGVPQRFYDAFAEWLAREREVLVLTYDYRDFGASRTGPARASKATMADWGMRDQQAAFDTLARLAPSLPLKVIGHSLGGLLLPFHDNAHGIDGAVLVASGPARHPDHPWPYRAAALAFWFGHAPLATALLGYLPGRALGFGADLPKGVYWQWRRWCTGRGPYGGDVGRALPEPAHRVTAPVRFVAVADDQVIPPEVVWRLMQLYPNAPKAQHVLRPERHGLRKVGHLGAFARANAAAWPALIGDAI